MSKKKKDQAVYRFSIAKAIIYTILGVVITSLVIIPIPIVRILFVVFGLGAFAMGIGAFFKRRPQIILNHEHIYLGFDVKKKIPWKFVTHMSLRKETIEARSVWYLKIRTRRVKNGLTVHHKHEANLQLLNIDHKKFSDQVLNYSGTDLLNQEELV